MSNQEKVVKVSAPTIPAPGTVEAVEKLNDMVSEEIKGVYTALGVIEPRLKALNDAVKAGKDTEGKLEQYRKDVTAQRAASPMFDAMLKSHPEIIADEERKIAEASRKAVTAEIETLNVQVSAIASHLMSTRKKYGTEPVTVKKAGSSSMGTVTDGNKQEILDALAARGYFAVSFNPLGDGVHYQVSAQAPSGKVKTGRYGAQIVSDWTEAL
jgi:hypothetical protein